MHMRKQLLLLSGFVMLSIIALAQHTITGKVTDDKGNPVPNASVIVKGTTTGTTSKADGSFSLNVSANARALIFSAVDMTTTEVVIGSNNDVTVSLKSEDKTLTEVVVTGYGTQRKKEVTGNIATVKG